MLHVLIVAELPEDETGPHVAYEERFVLPPGFAADAQEAHSKILKELREKGYLELPRQGAMGVVPLCEWPVREVAAWR